MTKPLTLPTLLLALTALGACQDHKDARPLHMEKGAYQGAPDTRLSGEQVEALRQRSFIQRF